MILNRKKVPFIPFIDIYESMIILLLIMMMIYLLEMKKRTFLYNILDLTDPIRYLKYFIIF